VRVLDRLKDNFKFSLIPNKMFENFGVKYYGPFDGHDIPTLINVLKMIKNTTRPVLLHVVTKKGKGVEMVEESPGVYHGVSPVGDNKSISYSWVVSEKICEMASNDNKVVAVTAAMSDGTGLTEFSKHFQNRYFDVGIAEQHAVSMCAGFQKAGLKPYFAVYSSFLQRAYDQVLSDVCIDNRGVTLLIDHAGVVGGDGVTHQGIYDISYLCAMPNMTIMQPKDGIELKNMMQFSLSYDRPLAIRYPKSYKMEFSEHKPIDDLSWEWIRKTNSNVCVLAVGNKMLEIALKNDNVNIISARVIKPLDEKLLAQIKNGVVITMEEGVLRGGFGEMIKSFYSNNADVKVHTLGFNDRFFDCLEEDAIFDSANLTIDALNGIVKKCL
jgi:1-deoxy-D-xylulose-5-phosphate synthase